MLEEFCTYEQALALKELGYDKQGFRYWTKNNMFSSQELSCEKPLPKDAFEAPLKQQVFKWFRDKHKIDSHVEKYLSSEDVIEYFFMANDEESINFETYEEAESACIDKLIEIVKKK